MDITAKYVTIGILVFNFANFGKTSVKIWKGDHDIHSPSNWVGGKAKNSCDGLDLTENDNADILIDNLSVKQIILPHDAILSLIEGAYIELNEQSTDVMNCARIKHLIEMHIWSEPEAWIIQDDDENVAIPHWERIPCKYDDVVYPKGYKSALSFVWTNVELNSFKFGEDYLKQEDLKNDENLNRLFLTFPIEEVIHITGKTCTDPTGCVCSNEFNYDVPCAYVNDTIYLNCLNPIMPIGFCTEMCGASIELKPKSNFKLANIRKSLKHYSSDTYASKVLDGSREIIQIIFSEKQFSGTSLDEAKDYYSRLLADTSLGVEDVEIYSSGPYFVEGKVTSNSLSLVFGTLCGVVIVFAIIFLVYSPQFATLNLRNRFAYNSRPLSSFRSNLFARYDNSENTGLILEHQSMAGSVLSLDKSFDNPMYGRSTPSTASTSYDTIGTLEEKNTKSEISLNNPMYDINNLDETVQEATEGDLVDLTGKEE
ncbi:hypothetical protein NQ314_014954 [Rhamnusium bicolor]|uniref:Protein amnionless n=1 Tax=Rhamnusium bicolor TaxID=1586634 RepID=A0AAV8X022_9CUCU|nr:hypothetical protein NQ314_014954 [Rhamnusium bicolor]